MITIKITLIIYKIINNILVNIFFNSTILFSPPYIDCILSYFFHFFSMFFRNAAIFRHHDPNISSEFFQFFW